jgi:two-component system chemotaxis response regulator CheY
MRFLLVDDDESVLLYLTSILAPHVQCETAASGEDALELFVRGSNAGTPYDVVMMDILLPGMSGHKTVEMMRDFERTQAEVGEDEQFKLVMISSLVDDSHVSRAFFKGHAICYLVKPFAKDKVLEELRQNLIL